MRDVVVIVGFVTLSVGAGLAWMPAGLMTAGSLLLLAGIAGHLRKRP